MEDLPTRWEIELERWKEPLKTATTPKNVQNTDAATIEAGQSQLDQEKTNQTLDSVNTESDGDAVGKAAIGATSAEKQTSDGDTAMSTNA
ncbi:hypothetical protein B5S28_g1102 [[Candida] boidinii]|nr:hypothetical protein B5S28_g1102 [[Candida] boidinii]OWB59740.1 hypothetical protein B5S29_g603 [[Candida] boidinii]OWB72029.1 hypothetical protein B5S31_g1730 [[Candida] boidinii]OWB80259.1 hypothetical protein B5S32_g4520 [[Candida] boidinii]